VDKYYENIVTILLLAVRHLCWNEQDVLPGRLFIRVCECSD